MPRRADLEPRKQPRQVRAELTRQRILDAAAEIFAEHGYAAGTTNRIAEQARISIGSLYQYYPNKDAILIELLTRHLDADQMLSIFENADPESDLEDLIRATVRSTISNHQDHPHLLRVMIEQAPRVSHLIDRVDQAERETARRLESVLREHPQVTVTDVPEAARLVVVTLELTVHHLCAAPDRMRPEQLENQLVAMLTNYLTH